MAASLVSIVARVTKAKGMHIDKAELKTETIICNGESYERSTIYAHVRPYKRLKCHCPNCLEKRPIYDHKAQKEVEWRGPNWNGVRLIVAYQPVRIECPKCGVLTEWIPWQDGKSHFMECFNNEVSYMASVAPKTVVSEYFDINWRTVGNCIKATHARLEPDTSVRLRNVRQICVDETSYKKGHKYITVVYDMERNRVIWVHEGLGEDVFSLFCEQLTEEERNKLEIVAGDGARWIDSCTKRYFPNAIRCVDFFHVVGWINETLDKVRINATRAAEQELEEQSKKYNKELKKLQNEWKKQHEEYEKSLKMLEKLAHRKGRRSKRDLEMIEFVAEFERKYGKNSSADQIQLTSEQAEELERLKAKASHLHRSKYALGKNPEHLTKYQSDKLKLIEASNDDVYTAYKMKEQLRTILHMKDLECATEELDAWIELAKKSNCKPFAELAAKIERHRTNILNAIQYQVNSSKSESTNTTIKSIISTARGFRNLDNLFAMIYLRCSDLVIPLDNRYRPSAEKVQEMRSLANERRRQREEAKRSLAS